MDRRNFLHLAAAAGLSVLAAPRRARAGTAPYTGPLWITVHAGGGWDPTSFCDPKGGAKNDRESVNQFYTPEEIVKVGAFSTTPLRLAAQQNGAEVELYSAKRFFENVGSRVVVVNGLDTSTNNHETGTRVCFSGRTAEGYPNIGALQAAVGFAKTPAPMAFLSYGGYDVTGGAVPLTRAGNIDNLWRVSYPFRRDPKKEDSGTYFTDATIARLQAAQQARAGRLASADQLPVARRALGTVIASRSGDAGLSDIAKYLPEKMVTYDDLPDLNGKPRGPLGNLENLLRQAQLALATFQAGVGVSASLEFGGFDTHSNHDGDHGPRLVQLLRGVEYILTEATRLGLADRLYVLVGSDFGRTPFYNPGNGKDHWAVTSMLVAGPGIVGGRVVGSSGADYKPVPLDKGSLAPSSSGVRLKPEHVHRALRQVSGLDKEAVAGRFPLGGDLLPILKP